MDIETREILPVVITSFHMEMLESIARQLVLGA